MKTGDQLIAAERQRQMDQEGYFAADDDRWTKGELAWAAACYAAPDRIYRQNLFAGRIAFDDPWPWRSILDKRPRPSLGNYVEPEKATRDQRISLLVKAGALIAAELDRLLREKAKEAEKQGKHE